jgi:tRNA (guanine37-N1)-methyltransferase
VIHLSPQGKLLTASRCRELAQMEHLVLLAGHYEGIDQRVIDREVDEEISIGDYVLTNGCLAAIVLVDAVLRFIPGVLGHEQAADEDSFENGIFDCPHYTRPEEFEGCRVPEVLLSGNHQKIALWRYESALEKTRVIRPDLYGAAKKR